jgi:CubicO group peptidase (beta-lactamase class C family)
MRRAIHTLIAAIVATAATCAIAAAQALSPLPPHPVDLPWPTQAWAAAPLPAGTDGAALDAALREAFPGPHPMLGETRALLAVQGGRLVFERYGDGYGATTRLVSWSMAKSITQALVGVAVQQGRLLPDQPMGNPRWGEDDPRAAITWRRWLQMTDGLRYTEIDAPSTTRNDAARMLFGPTARDVNAFAARLPVIAEPGVRWNYSTAGYMLIADALGRRVAPGVTDPDQRRAAMARWMRESLFAPIGMTSATPEFDDSGAFLGGSLVYASARDYARFGYLYLRDGLWDGRRILPPGWVDFARSPAPGMPSDIYGAGFWLTPTEGTGRPYRALIADGDPFDAFSAQGHEGQVILIVPSRDLVIVRLGRFDDTREQWDYLGDWLGRVARAFPARA